MDPLTIAASFLAVIALALLAWAASRDVPRTDLDDVPMGAPGRRATTRVHPITRVQAMSVALLVGVPLLMVGLSVLLPALRNPLFLVMGAIVGFLLPRSRGRG